MTEEQLKKIRWLNRAFHAEKSYKAWVAKLERDRSIAKRITRGLESTGGGSPGGAGNNTEDALIRLADTERGVQDRLRALAGIREEITQAIITVEDYDMQAILVRHYLAYETFDVIAERMHYDKRTIQRKHKAAIDKIDNDVIVCHPEM